jgi:hypothetical protein
MSLILHNGKCIVEDWVPVLFNATGRTQFDPAKDRGFYHVDLDGFDKLGKTDVGYANLVAQYASGGRVYGKPRHFKQFIAIDFDFLKTKLGSAYLATYGDEKLDDAIRDKLLEKGIAEEDGSVNKETVNLKGKTYVEALEELFKTRVRKLPIHSFIVKDVSLANEIISNTPKNGIGVLHAYKCTRYWKDFMSLNILANSNKTEFIHVTKMLTTAGGLTRKAEGLSNIDVIDCTPSANLSVDTIKKLYRESKAAGNKRVWIKSGFEGDSIRTRDLNNFFQSINDATKLIDIDEADIDVWKNLENMLSPILNGKGEPLIVIKTGSGYQKIRLGIAEVGLDKEFAGRIVYFAESITTQQDVEYAKFVDMDVSMSHVLAKCNFEVVIDSNDLSAIHNDINPDYLTDYSKGYADGDKQWLKGLFDRFFESELIPGATNRCYVTNILNRCIENMLIKHSAYYTDKDVDIYKNRSFIGVQINTQTASKVEQQKFADNFTELYGNRAFIIDASQFQRGNVESKVDKIIKKAFDDSTLVDKQFIVILNPRWAMANRSFSQGLIDMTIEARNNLDGQAENRGLTDTDKDFNNGLTVDGKKKLLSVSIHLAFEHKTSTMQQVYDQLTLDNKFAESEGRRKLLTPVANHWKFIGHDSVMLEEKDISTEFDHHKAFKTQILIDTDWNWVIDHKDILLDIKKKKISVTKMLKTGKKGTYFDSKKSKVSLPITHDERAELVAYMETVNDSIEWIIRYSKILNVNHLDLENAVNKIKEDQEIAEEFADMLHMDFDTWEYLYQHAYKGGAKEKLKLIYELNRE